MTVWQLFHFFSKGNLLQVHCRSRRWKTGRFLVPFRSGALFSVASYPLPVSAPNPRSERPPRTPGEMQATMLKGVEFQTPKYILLVI